MKNNPAWAILITSIIIACIFGTIEYSNKTVPPEIESEKKITTSVNKEEKKVENISTKKETSKEIKTSKIDKNKDEKKIAKDVKTAKDVKEKKDTTSKTEKTDKDKDKQEHKILLPPTTVKPAKTELVKIVEEKKKMPKNSVLLLNEYKTGEEIVGTIESHSYFENKEKDSPIKKELTIKKDIEMTIKNKINKISEGKVDIEYIIDSAKIVDTNGDKIRERKIKDIKQIKHKRANLDEFIFSIYQIKNNAIPEMPSTEMEIGDSWNQDIYTNVIRDKNFVITYNYKLTKYIKINGKECVEIQITADQNGIKEGNTTDIELKVNGFIYCDKSNGRIVKYDTKLEAKIPIMENSSIYYNGHVLNKFELK